MAHQRRLRESGNVMTSYVGAGLLILISLSAILNYFYTNRERYITDDGQTVDAKKLKDAAELVIVGTILNKRQKISQRGTGMPVETGVSYYDIAVETVERGGYSGSTISVAVGWFSSDSAPELFPPFLRKDYHKGEHIRIFLNYDPAELNYYTPALWYTIEPVS